LTLKQIFTTKLTKSTKFLFFVVLSKNGIFTTKNTRVMKIIYILLIYLIFVTFVSFVVKSFPIRRIKNDIFTTKLTKSTK